MGNNSVDHKKIVSWNSITFIFSLSLNFIVYSILYKSFDPGIFGVYLTAVSLYVFGSSLDLGIGISVIKVISQKRINNETEYIDKFLSTFFFVTMLIGMVISFIILINYYFLFSDMVSSLNINSLFLPLLALNFFCSFITGYLRVIYEGFYQYVLFAKISMLASILNLISALLIYFFSYSIIYLVVFSISVSSINFIILIYILYKKKLINIKFNSFSYPIFKENIRHNLNIQVSYIIGNSLEFLVRYIIGTMISYSYVTYYENAKKLANVANGVLAASQRNLLNKISELIGSNEIIKYLQTSFQIYPRISNSFSILIYGVLNPLVILFILFWFKSFETVVLYSILVFPYTIINYASPLYNVLLINKDGKYLIIIQTINVILTVLLLYGYLALFGSEIGIIGYNIAIFISLILILYFIKIIFKIEIKPFFKNIYGYNLLLFLLGLSIQLCIVLYFDNYILSSIIFSIIYLIVFYKEIKFFIINLLKLRL